jgi:hypothetical protein
MTKERLQKLHLALFVYGGKYFDICTSIVLPNLVALIGELPDDVRSMTELRILTDPTGRAKLQAAPALARIRALVAVRMSDSMEDGGYDLYGGYGPMILGQARLVHEASLQGAGIIFCPPDLVWSRGSFATIVRLAREGYRAVIGPSARGIEEELAPIFRRLIAASGSDRLDVSSVDLTRLMFEHWQKMNNDFFWNADRSIFWKSYAYWRVGDRQLLMKCWQGPALFLWPRREVKDYDGWIDHRLIKACVRSRREVYVVPDARQIQTLDLTPRDRGAGLALQSQKRWCLFRQLLVRKRHCRDNILYGGRSIRIYDTPVAEQAWRKAARQFDLETRPVMYAAIAARPVLALIDGAWRHSGLAEAMPRWRARTLELAASATAAVLSVGAVAKATLFRVAGHYSPLSLAKRVRSRLRIRTRLRRLGAAVLSVLGATGLRPRTRLKMLRRKLHDLLQLRT